MEWYWETLLQVVIFVIILFVILYGSSNFSVMRLILGSLFYLCTMGILNYKNYRSSNKNNSYTK